MPDDQHLDSLREKAVQQHLDHAGKLFPDAQALFNAVRSGDRQALARAITLAESSLPADRDIALQLLHLSLPYLQTAHRIGITGVPGVGKSTLINTLARKLADHGKKVAVLTIDPSSPQTRGSILGDKTRMQDLIANDRIFVRPSPSGNILGGVSLRTREAACLCEAAGYDHILIETVGVGQSETAVASMTDFFLLLVLPGAGDEIQGIKRGIIELADAIFVNKADGEMATLAEVACQTYRRSLHHFPARSSQWEAKVLSGAALTGGGTDQLIALLEEYFRFVSTNGYLAANRERQNKQWMHDALEEMIAQRLADPVSRSLIEKQEIPVGRKVISPPEAAADIFRQLFNT